MIDNIGGVGVVHWNPRAKRFPRPLGRIRYGRRVNNFGDLLGPMIVRRFLESRGVLAIAEVLPPAPRLLTVGSILHFAETGDVVWGSGVNGKEPLERLSFKSLDVRAVRGPRTARILEQKGISVPQVYGDPAILIPVLFPEYKRTARHKFRKTAFVPNLNDEKKWGDLPGLVSPRGLPEHIIREILGSEQVVTSSLHGLIVAEIFGVPVQLVTSTIEHELKYRDWVEGTGRNELDVAPSISDALKRLKNKDRSEILDFDYRPLLNAFPVDLWTSSSSDG